MTDAVTTARGLAERLAQELGIPFHAAKHEDFPNIDGPAILFRYGATDREGFADNTKPGRVTVLSFGVLPSLRSVNPREACTRLSLWLEGVLAVSLLPKAVRAKLLD